MRKRDEQKTAARNEDLLLSETLKTKKQQHQMQIYFNLGEILKTKKQLQQLQIYF